MDFDDWELVDKLLNFNIMDGKDRNFVDLFRQGQVPQDHLGITNEEMQHRYVIGHQLFEKKHYADALTIFADLTKLNPLQKSYWMAVATTQSRLGDQEEAVINFSLASLLEPGDPQPYYSSALCYVVLEKDTEARQSFELAAQVAAGQNAPLEKQAREWMEKLS